MYFKHKFHLLNIKRSKKYEILTSNEKYHSVIKLYEDFIKQYLKPLNKTNDVNAQKAAYKFLNKFQWYLTTVQEIEFQKLSINDYFRLKRKYSRTQFFAFKNKIINLINKSYFIWTDHIDKLPIKKNIENKYNKDARRILCDFYLKYCQESIGFEITDFWCKVHIENNLSNQFDFSKISINTLKKILSEELGINFTKAKKKYYYHPKRHKIIEPGHVQLDLKILGRNENGLNKIIPIFNMIDTHSRFTYSLVLDNASTQNVMYAIESGFKYFKSNGIKIKSVQTDNAMMFKNTNFVHANEFVKFLKTKGVIKRLIPLGQPECNGCVERFHKTIDKKCWSQFKQAKSIEEIKRIIFCFSYEYNFKRFHYYSELEHLPYAQRFLIPKIAINSNIMRYRSYQSKKMVH